MFSGFSYNVHKDGWCTVFSGAPVSTSFSGLNFYQLAAVCTGVTIGIFFLRHTDAIITRPQTIQENRIISEIKEFHFQVHNEEFKRWVTVLNTKMPSGRYDEIFTPEVYWYFDNIHQKHLYWDHMNKYPHCRGCLRHVLNNTTDSPNWWVLFSQNHDNIWEQIIMMWVVPEPYAKLAILAIKISSGY